MSILPIDAAERKAAPVFSGVLMYFPKTMVALARLSLAGNIQHYGPGTPLHWNREVSADHQDCMVRHAMQSGTEDTDGILHDVKAAWRALAQCEVVLDRLAINSARESELMTALAAVHEVVSERIGGTVTAHVPPFVQRDADDDLGLKAGEAISYGGTAE
ncbi:hypothetical protein ABIE51_001441 [Lysobacter sp. OAE881]|uniref:hypothetical protein n=1 Tax=Lysobacter sp. OAE881 TaxID=2663813 RepID=UPI001789C740